MNINDLKAPSLDDDLTGHLRAWGIEKFTRVQVLALEAGVAAGKSMVVCAPTSGGKTLVAEVAVLKALQHGKRCIYLVSHKALADQKYRDFQQRFGIDAINPIASVGLSTGDREEGDAAPQLLVSTYEKALALLLSGQMEPSAALVVADELQIIGEPGRGPNIETLCAILRQRKLYQLVALTATVGNPQEVADWFDCVLVRCVERDVLLHQEIWSQGRAHSVTFGAESGADVPSSKPYPNDPLNAVRRILELGRGPVLVFTESRNEATKYAEAFSQTQPRSADGLALAQELDLFSEPTEASEQLQSNAQRRVAFHTSDLTPQERQVIEHGFMEAKFEACFATSTLAAGVNFPFQTVVFPKLTYQWGERQGTYISRSDYRNMSGRAGRLGMHAQGYSILLPTNPNELRWANQLVLPENDKVASQLVSISMRRTILTLIASGVVKLRSKLRDFFENTLFWHQISEHNPKSLDDIIVKADASVKWLVDAKLIENLEDAMIPTPLGKAVAQSGLLPSTAINFCAVLQKYCAALQVDFEKFVPAFIHWACASDEFRGEPPSRFLIYPTGRNPVASPDYLSAHPLFAPLDRTDTQVNQCSHALTLYAQGVAERQIRFHTNIPSGGVHRLAIDVAWVLDGLQRVASVPEVKCPQTLTNQISMLARRVRWGAPAEVLDIIRVAQRGGVPGFGRQRAMALLAQGITTLEQILTTAKDKLLGILRNERRTEAFMDAMSNSISFPGDRYARAHQAVAAKLGISQIVAECNDALGVEYESAIKKLLEQDARWSITLLDDGKQQNVPDLHIRLADQSILLECKTTSKKVPMIKKEEAFAVLQKAVDFDKSFRRVTLGKPMFDEHSKKKVQAASDIALVEHSIFMEGVLQVLAGATSPEKFMTWLGTPGLVELDRLGGAQTIKISQQGT
ncbi:MAG: DEAD/DEAH box helicase [Magnetospirillum sp.]|nr:DEAD/DEAH box helicase [Magnetospirillum sp.]